ncbi:hypothetical protein Pth03_57560 [Planotetraspora thailandica]|uniref:Uncharacterized protein n=1 Tax=Planotetraspora thailandica TaxID=487172 RepID=A0A8J3XW95_9ACTN|nr:hypothetical protein [Planotetraspora thailandica]GII57367.1 hypothetical protein Pth03_57560 [Planotetraspora thailandica]
MSAELLQLLRHPGDGVEPQRITVPVDTSGGGRNTADVIGGSSATTTGCGSPTPYQRVMSSTDSWEAHVARRGDPAEEPRASGPHVDAKQGKLLRAEPIAQQMKLDRVRLVGAFPRPGGRVGDSHLTTQGPASARAVLYDVDSLFV